MKKYFEDSLKPVDTLFPEDFTGGNGIIHFKADAHLHSFTHAFGDPEERDAIRCSHNPVEARFALKRVRNDREERSQYILKLTAMLEEWRKYSCPVEIHLNGKPVFDGELFLENTCRGWPSVYYELSPELVRQGENVVTVANKSRNNSLIINSIRILEKAPWRDFEIIYAPSFVARRERFFVMLSQLRADANVTVETSRGILPAGEDRKGIRRVYFFIAASERPSGSIMFSSGGRNKTVRLKILPDFSGWGNPIWVGGDTDDVKQDGYGELDHFLALISETEIGNFVMFRPHKGRNYLFPPAPEQGMRWIEYSEQTGIFFRATEWPLPGAESISERMRTSGNFQGIHVHEPYIIFQTVCNPAFYRERRKPSVDRFRDATDVEKAMEAYREHLREEVQNYRKNNLPVSFGEPSLLAPYLPITAGDTIQAEPVTNISLLFGEVRAVSRWKNIRWGVHAPVDWYLGFPHDRAASRRFRLLANISFTHGANWFYAENSLVKTNAFERFDEEDRFCIDNRAILRDFYRYSRTHPRKGTPQADLAVVYGNGESMLWYPDDRIPELKDTNDFDLHFWGKWKNPAHFACWRALDGWLPPLPIDEYLENPSMIKLFSATPFGQVDVVPADAGRECFCKYRCLVFLGWNTMTPVLYRELMEYVKNGGILYLSGYHLDIRTHPEDTFKPFNKGEVSDLIGAEIKGIGGKIQRFSFESRNYTEKYDWPRTCKLDITSADVLIKDRSGNPVVLTRALGKGRVYFGNFRDFPSDRRLVEFNRDFMQWLAQQKTKSLIADDRNVINWARWANGEFQKAYLVNVDWKTEGNETTCFFTPFGRRIPLKVREGEIKEAAWTDDILVSPADSNSCVTGITAVGVNQWQVELLGYGHTRIVIALKHPGPVEILRGKKKSAFSQENGQPTLEIPLRGQTFLTVRRHYP